MKEIKDNSSQSMFRLLEALRMYQRNGRFVGSAYGTDLGTTEGFIIAELQQDSTLSIAMLAKMLGLNKATVSRSVASLIKRRYLKVKVDKNDSRRKILLLTQSARNFLNTHNSINRAILRRCSAHLSRQEVKELSELLTAYTDAEGAAPIVSTLKESSLILDMRRLARTHQITGSSFMSSGYSSIEWQILSLLAYDSEVPPISEMADLLTLQLSTLSQTLNRFVARGWIRRTRRSGDRRLKSIEITDVGRKVLTQIENAAFQRFATGMQGIERRKHERFVELFERYTGVRGSETLQHASGLALTRAQTPEAIQAARDFLISTAFANDSISQLGHILCAPENHLIMLVDGEVLIGIIEFTKMNPTRCLNFAVSRKLQDTPLALNFFLSSAELLINEFGLKAVSLSLPRSQIFKKLKGIGGELSFSQAEIQELRQTFLGTRRALQYRAIIN